MPKRCCLACGRPTDLTANNWCKRPDPDFTDTLAAMSVDEFQAACKADDVFGEHLNRWICREAREARLEKVRALEAAEREQQPSQPRQVSEDVSRYGRTEQILNDSGGEIEVEEVRGKRKCRTKVAEGEVEVVVPKGGAGDVPEDTDKTKAPREPEVGLQERIGSTKSQVFPVPVILQPSGKPIVIADSAAIHDEKGRPIKLPETPWEREQRILHTPLPPVNEPAGPPVELCRHKNVLEDCWLCRYEVLQALPPEERRAAYEKEQAKEEKRRKQPGGTLDDDRRLAGKRLARRRRQPGEEVPELTPRPKGPPFWNQEESWQDYEKKVLAYNEALWRWQADQDAEPKNLPPQPKTRAPRLRDELGLTPAAIIAFLDVVVKEHVVVVVDQPRKTEEKIVSRVRIEPVAELAAVAKATAEIEKFEQEIAGFRREAEQLDIKRLKKLPEGDSLRRFLNNEKERRTEQRRLERYLNGRYVTGLRQQIKDAKHTKVQAEKAIKEWRQTEHWDEQKERIEIRPAVTREVTEKVTFRELALEEFGDYEFNEYEGVIKAIELYERSGRKRLLAPRYYLGFGHFENQLIKFAIETRVFHPANLPQMVREINKNYPGSIDPNILTPKEPLEIEADDEDLENKAMTIKTGATNIGGHVVSAGYRNGKPRALDSFDNVGRRGGGNDGGTGGGSDDGGNWSVDVDTNDGDE